MKKLGGYLAGLMIVAGLILIMGTAGASDNGGIGVTQLAIRSLISILLMYGGLKLAEKVGGVENLD